MCEVLLATLLGDVVKSSISSGIFPFRLPRVAQDIPVDDLCDLMERFNVILGFQKDDGENGNGELFRIHRLRLVIFGGKKSTAAVMRLLEHIEELDPGCLGSLNPDSLELGDSHLGVSITKAWEVTMDKDWLQRFARVMEAGQVPPKKSKTRGRCIVSDFFLFWKVELILPNGWRSHKSQISGRLIPFCPKTFFFVSKEEWNQMVVSKSRFGVGWMTVYQLTWTCWGWSNTGWLCQYGPLRVFVLSAGGTPLLVTCGVRYLAWWTKWTRKEQRTDRDGASVASWLKF